MFQHGSKTVEKYVENGLVKDLRNIPNNRANHNSLHKIHKIPCEVGKVGMIILILESDILRLREFVT